MKIQITFKSSIKCIMFYRFHENYTKPKIKIDISLV